MGEFFGPRSPYCPRRRRSPTNSTLLWLWRLFDVYLWTPWLLWMQHEISSWKTRRRPSSGYPLGYVRPKRKKRTTLQHLVAQATKINTEGRDDQRSSQARTTTFDSDTMTILVDIAASACVTNQLSDFIEPPKSVQVQVTGISKKQAMATKKGTVAWRIEDDDGQQNKFVIRNTYCVPDAPHRLLCPQQWAQQANDHVPTPEGTGCMTTSRHVILFWDQRRHRKTIPLDTKLNIGFLHSAPGCKQFAAFVASHEMDHNLESNRNLSIFETHIIPDDEEAT